MRRAGDAGKLPSGAARGVAALLGTAMTLATVAPGAERVAAQDLPTQPPSPAAVAPTPAAAQPPAAPADPGRASRRGPGRVHRRRAAYPYRRPGTGRHRRPRRLAGARAGIECHRRPRNRRVVVHPATHRRLHHPQRADQPAHPPGGGRGLLHALRRSLPALRRRVRPQHHLGRGAGSAGSRRPRRPGDRHGPLHQRRHQRLPPRHLRSGVATRHPAARRGLRAAAAHRPGPGHGHLRPGASIGRWRPTRARSAPAAAGWSPAV